MRAWWLFSSQAIITYILAQLPCHVLALPSWEADFFFLTGHTHGNGLLQVSNTFLSKMDSGTLNSRLKSLSYILCL